MQSDKDVLGYKTRQMILSFVMKGYFKDRSVYTAKKTKPLCCIKTTHLQQLFNKVNDKQQKGPAHTFCVV